MKQVKSKARTIIIGDIQGCFDEFEALLKKIDLQKEDTVYLVGDMINKGPKSFEVLKYIYKHRQQFLPVLGNHEVNFLRWLDGEKDTEHKDFQKLQNKIITEGKEKYISYLKKLPLYRETDDFIVLHAGVIPDKKLSEHSVDEITRIREWNNTPWYNSYTGKKKIFYGHWAIDGIRIRKKTIGLDSGCCYGKALSAYIVETKELIQYPAQHIYVDIYKSSKKTLWQRIFGLPKHELGNYKN